MYKQGRPYTCLLIDSHEGYFICVPFRSNITHKNAFLFRNSDRSKSTKSGLDYSKIVIINNIEYIDLTAVAIVDRDEYNEMSINLQQIVNEAVTYVDQYIKHVTHKSPLHPREYLRLYGFTTLPYFHDILGISE